MFSLLPSPSGLSRVGPIPVLVALLASTTAATGQEGGAIRTGEHAGFSRIVMPVAPDTEWALETAGKTVIIRFPGRRTAFTTETVWERMRRDRVGDITSSEGPEGSEVRLDLACDCRATATLVDGRYLAIDIHDPAEAQTDDDPSAEASALVATAMEAARFLRAREQGKAALETAERGLMEQIRRAAGQGLIELADPTEASPGPDVVTQPDDGDDGDASASTPVSRREATAPRPAPRRNRADVDDIDLLAQADLSALDGQILATSVFDRDAPGPQGVRPEADGQCRPDADFDISRWSDGRSHAEQAAGLRKVLVGEFDRPDADAIDALARLHLRFGLGAESRTVLDGFEVKLADHDLLADLARLIDGSDAVGPLARDIVCPGHHGLWLAIAGSPAMLALDDVATQLEPTFAGLPPDLRNLLGPRLVTNLLEAGRNEAARLILEIALRPGQPPAAPLILASGRLAAAEGRVEEAEDALAMLVERRAHNSGDAALALVATRLAAGDRVPEEWITDLRTVAFEREGSPFAITAATLVAEAEARNGDIRESLAMLAALAAGSEDGRIAAHALAPRLLAEAEIEGTGAAFAEAALEHHDLLAPAPEHDAHRLEIATKLLDLGLASPAIDVLGPMIARDSEPARVAAARAHLMLGDTAAAERLLDGIAGTVAASLRTHAAERAANHAAPEPMPIVALARETALEEPSLGAARRLLESGSQVRHLIDELLAEPADSSDRPG